MKTLLIFVITVLWVSGSLCADLYPIELGNSRTDVTRQLGEPIGTLGLGNKTILIYPQGEITLQDNAVSAIDLMSDTEFAAELERRRLEREEWRIQQEKLSAKPGIRSTGPASWRQEMVHRQFPGMLETTLWLQSCKVFMKPS